MALKDPLVGSRLRLLAYHRIEGAALPVRRSAKILAARPFEGNLETVWLRGTGSAPLSDDSPDLAPYLARLLAKARPDLAGLAAAISQLAWREQSLRPLFGSSRARIALAWFIDSDHELALREMGVSLLVDDWFGIFELDYRPHFDGLPGHPHFDWGEALASSRAPGVRFRDGGPKEGREQAEAALVLLSSDLEERLKERLFVFWERALAEWSTGIEPSSSMAGVV